MYRATRPCEYLIFYSFHEGMGFLGGYKKEVYRIYRTFRLALQAPRPDASLMLFQRWHDTPYYPILIAGGSKVAIFHWDLSSPTASTCSLLNCPIIVFHCHRRHLLVGNACHILALRFHPLGHLLVSASNDRTTHVWPHRQRCHRLHLAAPTPWRRARTRRQTRHSRYLF